MGVVGAIMPWNFPFEVTIEKLGQILATGQHDRPQAGARHAVERHPARPPRRREDRHPAGCVQRRHVVRPPRRRRAHAVAAGRHDLVHRLDRHRQADHGEGRGHDEARLPRARRQVGDIVLDDADFAAAVPSGVDGVHARRPGLRDADAGCCCRGRATTRASSWSRRPSSMVPYGDPTDPNVMTGPLISAKQRDRVLGYIEKGKDEGAKLVLGGGRPAQFDEGLLRGADAVRRRRQLDDHRPGGDLRPGARRDPVRGRRRRRAHRQRQRLRPLGWRALGERGAGDGRRAAHPHRHRSASTAACGTAPTRPSAATRPAASAARTASRASSSTSRPRPSPGCGPDRDASAVSDDAKTASPSLPHEGHPPEM